MHDASAHREFAVDKPAHGARVDHMLLRQHARGEAFGVVVRQHRHGGLDHDRAVVELSGHKMHRCTVQLAARSERALVGVQTRKGRQQRGVNVEQAAIVVAYKRGRENAHETGQHHEIRRVGINRGDQRGVEGFARGVVAVRQGKRRHATCTRGGEAVGLCAIADHSGNPGGELIGVLGSEQGFHVAAASGDQDDQLLCGIFHSDF